MKMKLIMENWNQFLIREECKPGHFFDAETGDLCPGVDLKSLPKDIQASYIARKRKGVTPGECKPGAMFDAETGDLCPGADLKSLPKDAQASYIARKGSAKQSHAPRQKATEVPGKSKSSVTPSRVPRAAPTTSPEKSQSAAAPRVHDSVARGLEKLKSGLKQILSNPNIPAADKEEAKRDFEEAMRELAQG